jgi:hypothetical protein
MPTWLIGFLMAGAKEAGQRAIGRQRQHAALGHKALSVFERLERAIWRQATVHGALFEQRRQARGCLHRRHHDSIVGWRLKTETTSRPEEVNADPPAGGSCLWALACGCLARLLA